MAKAPEYTSPTIDRQGPVPVQYLLPSLSELSDLSPGELLAVMQRFGVAGAWSTYIADQAAYLARVASLPPAQFDAALQDLVDTNSKRALVQMSRRLHEQYTTGLAAAGDEDARFIRLDEGDSRECERCEELGGYEGTYAEQQAVGLPGAASCRGGDQCRCTLVRID